MRTVGGPGASTIVVAVLLLIATLPGCEPAVAPPRYHVLLVTLDTTRADRLGCYGDPRPTSRELDRLAAESAVFDAAIAQAAVTPVSHASILTGLDPHHHGLRVMHGLVANRLDEAQETVAETWLAAGGRTAAVVSAYPVTDDFGLAQGFEHFDASFLEGAGQGRRTAAGQVNTGLSQRGAKETTDAAIAWLHSVGQSADLPFLLWVHYFDPHDDFLLPPPDLLEALMDGPLAPAGPSLADTVRAHYDCDVHFMDHHLGRLLRELRVRGLWERTIIAVVADHGEGLGDHDWWTHGILYQEQIRVPCIVRLPGMTGGRRIASLVRTTDLVPTLLEAAGVDRALWPAMDGRSLVETIAAGRTAAPRSAYSESVNMVRYARHDAPGTHEVKDDKLYALIDGPLKLIHHQLRPEESELYDLSTDPGEQVNLAARPAHRADMERLTARLDSMGVESPIMPGMSVSDLERLRRLERLGYVR
ncbi:MAG: sulfatase [Candidatus Eiseniibacteriota bacterium]|jgi:arylsulfatase A-like enzyme